MDIGTSGQSARKYVPAIASLGQVFSTRIQPACIMKGNYCRKPIPQDHGGGVMLGLRRLALSCGEEGRHGVFPCERHTIFLVGRQYVGQHSCFSSGDACFLLLFLFSVLSSHSTTAGSLSVQRFLCVLSLIGLVTYTLLQLSDHHFRSLI